MIALVSCYHFIPLYYLKLTLQVPPAPPFSRSVSEPTNRNLSIHLRSGTFVSHGINIPSDIAEDNLSVTGHRGSPVALTPPAPHTTDYFSNHDLPSHLPVPKPQSIRNHSASPTEPESEPIRRYPAEEANDPWNPNQPYLDLRAHHEAHVIDTLGYLNPDRLYPDKMQEELESLEGNPEGGKRRRSPRKRRVSKPKGEDSQGLDRYKKDRDDHARGGGGMSVT